MNIFITGANRGLGYNLVKSAVKRGHHVIAGIRNKKEPGTDFTKLLGEFPELISTVELDVADENTVARASREVSADNQSIDAIVNNAAVLLGRDDTIETLDFDQVRRTFEINTFGAMRVVKHFLPMLYKGTSPALINVSSEAGSITNAYNGDFSYAMSKTAMNMFTKQMHSGLADKGILVCSIHPGWMKTDMGGDKAPMQPTDSAEGILDIIERKTPIGGDYKFVNHLGLEMKI